MSERDDAPLTPEEADDALAAEYVLRLLDPEEEAAVRARAARDPAFAALVEHWRSHFAAWDDRFEAAAPPPALWARIERRLFPLSEALDGARFRRSLAVWRGVAAAAAAAAVLFAVLALVPDDPPAAPARLVAALDALEPQQEAAFLALLEPETRRLHITRTAGTPDPGRSFELWLVEEDTPPVSLGLLPEEDVAQIALPAALLERVAAGVVLAVSDEPAGGSPTGAPTGPVLAAGPARPI
jgi:anti-sigma-K factor RskA